MKDGIRTGSIVRQDFRQARAAPWRGNCIPMEQPGRASRLGVETVGKKVSVVSRSPCRERRPATRQGAEAWANRDGKSAARTRVETEFFRVATFASAARSGDCRARLVRGKNYQDSSIEARALSVRFNTEITCAHASAVTVPLGCPPMERHAIPAVLSNSGVPRRLRPNFRRLGDGRAEPNRGAATRR